MLFGNFVKIESILNEYLFIDILNDTYFGK